MRNWINLVSRVETLGLAILVERATPTGLARTTRPVLVAVVVITALGIHAALIIPLGTNQVSETTTAPAIPGPPLGMVIMIRAEPKKVW